MQDSIRYANPDTVVVDSQFLTVHNHDYREQDLHQLSNVPVQTNGDVDHVSDKAIVKFQTEFHELACTRTYAIQCLLHLVAHRPRLLRRLRSHRFDTDSMQHVDIAGADALKQVRAIRVADLLLARAGHAAH